MGIHRETEWPGHRPAAEEPEGRMRWPPDSGCRPEGFLLLIRLCYLKADCWLSSEMPFPFTKPENRESVETASLMLLHFRKNAIVIHVFICNFYQKLILFSWTLPCSPFNFFSSRRLCKLAAGWFPQPGHITPGFGEKGIVFEMDSPVFQR